MKSRRSLNLLQICKDYRNCPKYIKKRIEAAVREASGQSVVPFKTGISILLKAEKWHPRLLKEMPNIETVLLIGSYAQKYYLAERRGKTLTETVRNFNHNLPKYLPLVHPSPLNVGWFKQNPWFDTDVLPVLKRIVEKSLKK